MTHLTVSLEQGSDFTVLSNRFIDEYMVLANDAQIKIYLYLLRMSGANLPFGISDIADHFNYMEQDVLRALCYWEKNHLLSLDFDSAHNVKAIRILPLPSKEASVSSDITPSLSQIQQAEIVPLAPKLAISNVLAESSERMEKPNYGPDDLVAFKNNNETSQIIFIAESYTGKPLSSSDMQTLLYIYDKLGFSIDLIDYLIQYCVDLGKKKFSYIQKVAIDWYDSHITTVEQAKNHTGKYDKSVYTIMKALGKNTDPTTPEIAFIRRWSQEWGFSTDLILKACERTVLNTDNHRFEYTNGILSKWHAANVKSLQDVEALEEKHRTKTTKTSSKNAGNPKSGFNDFSQRSYDYEELEKALLRSN